MERSSPSELEVEALNGRRSDGLRRRAFGSVGRRCSGDRNGIGRALRYGGGGLGSGRRLAMTMTMATTKVVRRRVEQAQVAAFGQASHDRQQI